MKKDKEKNCTKDNAQEPSYISEGDPNTEKLSCDQQSVQWKFTKLLEAF